MKLNIPLNLASRPPIQLSPQNGVRLRLPLGLRPLFADGVQGTSATSRQEETLRAVAAAAALYDPGESLELVKLADDAPEKVIAPSLDVAKLDEVLNAVGRVQDQPGNAPTANKAQIAAAIAADVRPELVAAALQSINAGQNAADRNARAAEARKWVAAVNPTLLATAARAGATTQQLDRVPTQTSRLDRVEESIGKLDERVKRLEGKKATP